MTPASTIKNAIFDLANRVRLTSAIGHSEWRRRRLLILCYHGISMRDEHEWSDLYVSPAHFGRRLTLLKEVGVRVASLDVALTELWSGTLEQPTVVITFDDGPADFALRAVPALVAQRMPATVYLTTYYAQRQLPVFDTWASYLIWKGAGQQADLGPLGVIKALPMASDKAWRNAMHTQLRERVRELGLDADQKNDIIRKLCASLEVDYEALCAERFMHIMNETETRALPTDLIDIELHTHRHRSPTEPAVFREEIATNEHFIRLLSGDSSSRKHFCYPSGVYGTALRNNVEAYPLESATTCDPGLASASSDRLLLPRFIDTMNVPEATFLAWVSGAAALLPRRRA
jgi:peptidoglycan/xylan/chitin deacetylase (PgdA/CDA1 family)